MSTKFENWLIGLGIGLVQAVGDEFMREIKLLPNPFSGLGDAIGDWWDDAIHDDFFDPTANNSQDPARGYEKNGLGFWDGFMNSLTEGWNSFKEDMGIADWKLPEIPFDLSGIENSIINMKNKVLGWIKELSGLWDELQFWKHLINGDDIDYSANVPFGAGGGKPAPFVDPSVFGGGIKGSLKSAGMGLSGGDGWAIPALDLTAFKASISTAKDELTAFTADPYKAFLAADYMAVDQASQVAFTLGGAWDQSVHTGKFNGDPSNADKASQAAWLLGQNWDGQIFTARFDVDTSGITNAVAIARQAAADIAAVMPHSPADEGPLKRPITFDYIAENMRRAMSLVTGYANAGAASVASYLGGAADYLNAATPAAYASKIPNRGVVNNYVDNRQFFALKTAEFVRMMNQAENGDRLWQAAQSVEFS